MANPERFCCLAPFCTADPFDLLTELERHYKEEHEGEPRHGSEAATLTEVEAPNGASTPEENKAGKDFGCDYDGCSAEYTRKHRLLDHLRRDHGEAIKDRPRQSRLIEVGQGSTTFSRCAACLARLVASANAGATTSCRCTLDKPRTKAKGKSRPDSADARHGRVVAFRQIGAGLRTRRSG